MLPTLAVNTGYTCGLCGKTFIRHDLRDRHKRRCLERLENPRRTSKRRSCLACVASKLRCDAQRPACSRCLERYSPCQYDKSSTVHPIGQLPLVEEDSPDLDSTGSPYMQSPDLQHRFVGDFPTSGALPDSCYSQLLSSTKNPGTLCEIPGQKPIDDPLDVWSFFGACPTDASPWEIGVPDWNPAHSSSGASLLSIMGTETAPLWQRPKANALVASQIHVSPYDQALIHVLAQYPQMMLSKDCPPPFFHPLYPDGLASWDVPAPLATAICCINAFNVASPNSRNFVNKLLDTERERLVKQFSSSPCDLDTLALVQSTLLYQILGFFGNDPDGLRGAQLYNRFLIYATRQLAKDHHNMLIPQVSEKQSNTTDTGGLIDRRGWIRAETMRRTIFAVQALNVLSARIGLQDLPCFHDSLDEDLILNMPLPASETDWKSTHMLNALPWMADPELLPNNITPLEFCTLSLPTPYSPSNEAKHTQIPFIQLVLDTRLNKKASEFKNL